jgi:colanic acid/amylovoran biosynthesis protein
MRILVEPSGYHLQNLGDVAMMQTAMRRLRALWPTAEIFTLTTAPQDLARLCPDFQPLSPLRRLLWDEPLAPARLHARAGRAKAWLDAAERAVRQRWPRTTLRWLVWKHDRRGMTHQGPDFWDIFLSADLLVMSGAGMLNDHWEDHYLRLLDLLALARQCGKPTAMVGQGLGPVTSPSGLRRCRQVLRGVDLIAVREGRYSPEFLKKVGVSPSRVIVTGDDAVEMAHAETPPRLGAGLGVNVRLAKYANVAAGDVDDLGTMLRNFAAQKQVALVSVPISRVTGESDELAIARLLGKTEVCEPSSPREVIHRAGRCRVVVTGSYHAAVFALAQGVPAVGLAKTEYYVQKFRGLTHMFGRGCQVVALDGPEPLQRLQATLADLWASAPALRPGLLNAAEQQAASGQAAYRRLTMLLPKRAACPGRGLRLAS